MIRPGRHSVNSHAEKFDIIICRHCIFAIMDVKFHNFIVFTRELYKMSLTNVKG
jgi:hypothetical protein